MVIADDFHPWYVGDRRHERAFYWPAYQQYLLDSHKWPTESVVALNDSTADVVGRLSDPTRDAAYKSRGLVVGYVQSGKTANFTGVLAKVIDAGYRLLIVMTGTIDLLREQTQRRIDMELVGRENILRGIDANDSELMHDVDYQDDKNWIDGTFISHGTLPSDSGHPDIIRLTTHRFDYQSLRAGINALDFEKRVPTLPLYHKDNLIPCAARLVIVKKNKRVLTKLVRDLKRIMPRLHEVPALIIDDESDHASVNTSDPRRWEEGQTGTDGYQSTHLRAPVTPAPVAVHRLYRPRRTPTSSSIRAMLRTFSQRIFSSAFKGHRATWEFSTSMTSTRTSSPRTGPTPIHGKRLTFGLFEQRDGLESTNSAKH